MFHITYVKITKIHGVLFFMCTIKEKYCISDFSGFCGKFTEKLGRKDPRIFV